MADRIATTQKVKSKQSIVVAIAAAPMTTINDLPDL
jgi:hypothetical protein